MEDAEMVVDRICQSLAIAAILDGYSNPTLHGVRRTYRYYLDRWWRMDLEAERRLGAHNWN